MTEHLISGFPGGIALRNIPANTSDTVGPGSSPASGRSPAGGNGNPLQYSCVENPMDRGTWWATVHGVTESDRTEATEHTHLYYISWRQVAAVASSWNHRFFARLSIEVTFHGSPQVCTFMLHLPSGEGVSFLIPWTWAGLGVHSDHLNAVEVNILELPNLGLKKPCTSCFNFWNSATPP